MLSTLLSTTLGPAAFLALLQTLGAGALGMQPRQNDGDSDSDSDSDSGSNSRSCRRGVCTITSCKNNVCQTVISTRGSVAQTLSAGHTSVISMGVVPTPAPTSSTGTTTSRSSSTSTSGTLSAHPSTISSISGLSTQNSSRPSNGALAGIAVAAFIAIGLLAMWLARVRNRRRRREKRPQGFSSTAFLTGTGGSTQNNHDYNNMAQVESGNRSPGVGLTHMNGNVGGISYRNDYGGGQFNPDTASPLSPLPPAVVTQGYEGRVSPNTGQAPIRSASRLEDGASVLTSPYSENSCAAEVPVLPRETSTSAAVASSSSSPPPPPTAWNGAVQSVGMGAGTLYSDMHSFQKHLEADKEKQSASGRLLQEPMVDTPPSYLSSTR